jgi:hypothetical protein
MLITVIPFCNSQFPMKKEHVITLQSVPVNASSKLLSESKEVLLRRLECMSLRNVQVIQNDAKSELIVTVDDTINRETLSELLLVHGGIYFYETMSRQEVLKCFGKQSTGCIQGALTALHFRDTVPAGSESILGIADWEDITSINACLTSKDISDLLPKQVKLLWGTYPTGNNLYNLYCITSSGKPFNGDDIQEAHGDFANPELPTLCVTFKENVWKSWRDATTRNINESMVLAVDDKVIAAPRIADEIPCGKISLTGGGFSKTEVKKLAAIISGGSLPLKFTVLNIN